MRKKTSTFLIVILFGLILIGMIFISKNNVEKVSPKQTMLKTKVTKLIDTRVDTSQADAGVVTEYIYFEGKLLNTKNKGNVVKGKQIKVNSDTSMRVNSVGVGDIVYLEVSDDNGYHQILADSRQELIIGLIVLLFILLIFFGHSKGIRTIIALVYTVVAVINVFIPSILAGQDSLIWGIIVTTYSVLSTLMILNGFSKKTLGAIIGCIGGATAIIILSLISIKISHLTGLASNALYLKMSYPIVDTEKVLISSFLIGAIGAVMDVSVELSASLYELWKKAKDKSSKSLIKSGLEIGKDMTGTMSNTLVLAYVSGSFINLAYYYSLNYNFWYMVSTEMIASEIIQILVGSLGILLTIPITTIACAFIYNRKEKRA